MHFRFITYAKNEAESLYNCENILGFFGDDFIKKEYDETEPYWKCEGMFETGVTVILKSGNNLETITPFLKSVSNIWKNFGLPVDHVLITDTMDNEYIAEGLVLLSIFF